MPGDGSSKVPVFNPEIGQNFDLWKEDRGGFHTSVDMVTGGKTAAFGEHAGIEVGANYQGGMGEERTETSYPGGNPMHVVGDDIGKMGAAMGSVSAGSFGAPRSGMSGKTILGAPQNYRTYGKGNV